MSEEAEGQDTGAEAVAGGADAAAMALALGGASREDAAPPAPEEPPMEIHKPHAAKTWKEFFIELATITAGILIALGLEQLVDHVRWHYEVTEGRQAIMAEIAANNDNLLAFRVAVAPCVDRQIREAETTIAALEAGQKPSGMKAFRPPLGAIIRDSEWQSERASQVLTHFPRDELALMSRYYGQLPEFRDFEEQEGAPWRELSILRAPPEAMTASDLIRLKVNLEAAKFFERLIVVNARRQLGLSQRLGVNDSGLDPARVRNYCTMTAQEYARFRDIQDLH